MQPMNKVKRMSSSHSTTASFQGMLEGNELPEMPDLDIKSATRKYTNRKQGNFATQLNVCVFANAHLSEALSFDPSVHHARKRNRRKLLGSLIAAP